MIERLADDRACRFNLAAKRWSALFCALAALTCATLSGCASTSAHNSPPALMPVNAADDGGDKNVILQGYDVVAYFTEGRPMPGSIKIKTVYENVTFRFANFEHKALFDLDPQRYIPQYGGYCANGIVYGIPSNGNAEYWHIEYDKLYIFDDQGAKDGFELDLPGHIALADKYWREEIAGRGSLWQRTKRTIVRVPHYKSSKEIADEVTAARAKEP